MLIDSHAHINYGYKLDTQQIIQNMKEDNLEAIVNIGTSMQSSKDAVVLSENNQNVYAAVGLHPEATDELSEDNLKELERLAKHEKVVAIGEIGLDYFVCPETKNVQRELFVRQLEIAERVNLPVCIHSRNSRDDVYEILSAHKDKLKCGGVMHCFCENLEYAKKFIELGFYISFSGNITFKKVDRSWLKELPIDRILVETDCPFLSPEPLRGRVNEPKNVCYTAQKIADALQMDFDEFQKITTNNTKRIYSKIK